MSKLSKLAPDNFDLETTTVWSFPERGKWATHQSSFRGNWAPQIPRNLILRYSNSNDLVLDQMCGCGTTLIECKLTGRDAIGIDINPMMVEMSKKNLIFDSPAKVNIEVKVGDARNLKDIKDNSVDLIGVNAFLS